ncbi:MAG: murein L,D-transpeptidase catalytic domain family protein [Prolixibacteraceae bacterium]
MMKKVFLTVFILIFCWIAEVSLVELKGSVRHSEPLNTPMYTGTQALYRQLSANRGKTLPAAEVLAVALKGFNNLKSVPGAIKKDILTIIDFSLPSNEKRLWVIDLQNRKILYNDLVAHGKNSGGVYARNFSNTESTYMSSLGFYLTGNTYQGKHGLSLILEGMDKDFNDNARNRAIVMHGANYVSNEFIKKYGRLGRSFGCPSLPPDISKKLINTIRDGSCLFIYYPDKRFLAKSQVLNPANQLFTGLQ